MSCPTVALRSWSFSKELSVLDMRDGRKLSDAVLSSLSSLSKLQTQLPDGTYIYISQSHAL